MSQDEARPPEPPPGPPQTARPDVVRSPVGGFDDVPGERAFQLVTRPGHDREYPALGVRVLDYERFLAGLV